MKQQNDSTGSKRTRAAYEYPNNAKNEKMEKRAAWTNDTTTMLMLKEENPLVDFAWNCSQYCDNVLHELYYKVLNICSTKLIDEMCDILYQLSEDKVHIVYILTGLHYMDRTHQFNLLSSKINMISTARYGCDGHMDLDGNATSMYSTSYHLHSPVIVLDKICLKENQSCHDVLVSIADHLSLYLEQCEEKTKRSSGSGAGVGRLSTKAGIGGCDDVSAIARSGSSVLPFYMESSVYNKHANPLRTILALLQRHSMLLASIQHCRHPSETIQQDHSLVVMFEYGEYLNSDVLADICLQLRNLGQSGDNDSDGGPTSSSLRVLVIVVQSAISEVDLCANPSIYASPFITVNILPTNLKSGSGSLPQCDPTSRLYLYDEFCKYAFNLKYTYAHIPYDLLCHINEQFNRLNHCVYTSVLQTLCCCLSMHFKSGSGTALSFFKNIEFVRKQQFAKGVATKLAFSSEVKCVKRLLDTVSVSYCINEWSHPYSPCKERAFSPLIFRKGMNGEEIVGCILNSHYKYQEINSIWLFCLKILGDVYVPERMLDEYTSIELWMSIASYRYKDSIWHCSLIDKLIDNICFAMRTRCCGSSSKKYIEQLLSVLQYIYETYLLELKKRSKYSSSESGGDTAALEEEVGDESGKRLFDCYNDREYHLADEARMLMVSDSTTVAADPLWCAAVTENVRIKGDKLHDEYCRLMHVMEELIFEILPAVYAVDEDLDSSDPNYDEYIIEYRAAVDAKVNIFSMHSGAVLDEIMIQIETWLHDMSNFMCTSRRSTDPITDGMDDSDCSEQGKRRPIPDALPGILDFTWDTLHASIDEALNSNVRVKWVSSFTGATRDSTDTNAHASDIALLVELLGMSVDSTRSEPPISEIFTKFCERATMWKCHLEPDSILSKNVDYVCDMYSKSILSDNTDASGKTKAMLDKEQKLKKRQISNLTKMRDRLEAQLAEMNLNDDIEANGVSALLSCRFICCLNEIENSGCISIKRNGSKISFRKDAFCWLFDK